MKKHLLFTLIITMLLSMVLVTVALAEKPPGKHDIAAIGLTSDPVGKTIIVVANDPVDRRNLTATYVAQIPSSSTFGPPGGKHTIASTPYFPHELHGAGHIVASTETWHKIRGTPA